MQNLGSLSEINNNSHEVALIVESILDDLRKQLNVEGLLKICSFKSQIVSGTIYFIKIFVNEKYLHIKVLEYLPHENKNPELLSYLENQTLESDIKYF